jgi:hypothetical protein
MNDIDCNLTDRKGSVSTKLEGVDTGAGGNF